METSACPDCPVCGHPPLMALGETAFCGNERCAALSWSLDRTPAENLRHFKPVDLSGLFQPGNGDDV